MKKIILIFATTTLSLLIINTTSAQDKKRDFKFTGTDSALIARNDAKPPIALNTNEPEVINSRATRFFNQEFKNAEAVKWFKIDNGFVTYFTMNGIRNKVFYTKKGDWAGSITYYNDKTMPRDVRATVRTVYYDYTITLAEEIRVADKIVFRVHMEDETSWKIVDVCEGEITEISAFKKQL